MSLSVATIRSMEEISLNAWPALKMVCLNGWLLRFAEGYTRRANSVHPLYSALKQDHLVDQIEQCETLYARMSGQDVLFKMTRAALPKHLDSLLAERGYRREAETSVQALNLQTLPCPSLAEWQGHISSRVTETWLSAYRDMANLSAHHGSILRQMFERRVSPATGFAAIRAGDEIVAVGMAVAERGYVGLFDIYTAAEWRRQGIGTRLLESLLSWGRKQGAREAYLQVMGDNKVALRLYARIGFKEVYRYWYRVKAVEEILRG